jgi:23S rRNA (uridine2552-2'-O)-methyltransferase|tara:strand:- start:2201 stop:2791 length:591 start_codon:yes stop_codon:yes gene_type:complete
MKLIDAKKDQYRKLAHEQGYRSRAAYKLKEINKSYRIIGPGSYVLDLGCAPGGWSQIAQKISGNQGKVLGIDTSFVEDIQNVKIIQGDIDDPTIVDEIIQYFGKKADSVICDLSPQVSGNWSVDHATQISLNYSAVKIMDKVLEKKGNALFKVFDGEYSSEFYDFIRKKFIKTKLTKPKASRKPSSELYCICMGLY